ncbi:hypothetical protein U8P76_30645 (plasmid) [Rhizobium johnstonii]|nr:hypothetical protein U8P76_30645 [Rhizobium johnstonii]
MRTHVLSKAIMATLLSVSLPAASFAADCPRSPENPKRLTKEAQRTVVITAADMPAVFDNDRFSLAATLQSILETAFVPDASSGIPVDVQRKLATSKAEQIALLTSLIRSFRVLGRSVDGVVNNATFRPHEAELAPETLLSEMKPVGLFNRFDLAPANWSYCGEHRVVYAMGTGTNRLFLIFEAAVDNPDQSNARSGCQRVAEFWARIQFAPEGDLPDVLKGFYFEGDLKDGKPPIARVLHNQHLGVPFGQVRGNLFMTQPEGPSVIPWMLREWRTFPSAQTTSSFVPDTVKSNPNVEFYNDSPIALGASGRTQSFVDLRAEFQDKVVVSHVRELLDVDLEAALHGAKPNADDLFNQLSAAFDDRFNDFESVSQSRPAFPGDVVTGSMGLKQQIDRELEKYKLPANWNVTSENILARAEALSCGGCHNLTQGKSIASSINAGDAATSPQDVVWPNALAFTHIDETATLSEALLDSFLPARCDNLQRFLAPSEQVVSMTNFSSQTRLPSLAKTRLTVDVFRSAETEAESSDALSQLATDIQTARDQDSKAAGAFRRFRRTH